LPFSEYNIFYLFFNRYQDIVDVVISLVVKKRGSTAPYKGLTDQDLFFREVSYISDIFEGFLEYEEEMLKGPSAQGTDVKTIAGINTLMQVLQHNTIQ
jgi:hypothetical protein